MSEPPQESIPRAFSHGRNLRPLAESICSWGGVWIPSVSVFDHPHRSYPFSSYARALQRNNSSLRWISFISERFIPCATKFYHQKGVDNDRPSRSATRNLNPFFYGPASIPWSDGTLWGPSQPLLLFADGALPLRIGNSLSPRGDCISSLYLPRCPTGNFNARVSAPPSEQFSNSVTLLCPLSDTPTPSPRERLTSPILSRLKSSPV